MNASDLLTGKVALITGASKGIGKAIALAFAKAGAHVAACSRGSVAGQLEAVAADIKKLGRPSLAIQADTAKKDEVDRMVNTTLDNFGRIDILVNNAGILIRSSLLSITESDWDTLMAVDLKGFFLCSQAVGRIMRDQKSGNIINVSSAGGVSPSEGLGPYCISKAGINMLTKQMALEMGPYNVRVNAIAPRIIKTEFSKALWTNEKLMEREYQTTPLKCVGTPEEMAQAALYLASSATNYMTGHILVVNGGAFF